MEDVTLRQEMVKTSNATETENVDTHSNIKNMMTQNTNGSVRQAHAETTHYNLGDMVDCNHTSNSVEEILLQENTISSNGNDTEILFFNSKSEFKENVEHGESELNTNQSYENGNGLHSAGNDFSHKDVTDSKVTELNEIKIQSMVVSNEEWDNSGEIENVFHSYNGQTSTASQFEEIDNSEEPESSKNIIGSSVFREDSDEIENVLHSDEKIHKFEKVTEPGMSDSNTYAVESTLYYENLNDSIEMESRSQSEMNDCQFEEVTESNATELNTNTFEATGCFENLNDSSKIESSMQPELNNFQYDQVFYSDKARSPFFNAYNPKLNSGNSQQTMSDCLTFSNEFEIGFLQSDKLQPSAQNSSELNTNTIESSMGNYEYLGKSSKCEKTSNFYDVQPSVLKSRNSSANDIQKKASDSFNVSNENQSSSNLVRRMTSHSNAFIMDDFEEVIPSKLIPKLEHNLPVPRWRRPIKILKSNRLKPLYNRFGKFLKNIDAMKNKPNVNMINYMSLLNRNTNLPTSRSGELNPSTVKKDLIQIASKSDNESPDIKPNHTQNIEEEINSMENLWKVNKILQISHDSKDFNSVGDPDFCANLPVIKEIPKSNRTNTKILNIERGKRTIILLSSSVQRNPQSNLQSIVTYPADILNKSKSYNTWKQENQRKVSKADTNSDIQICQLPGYSIGRERGEEINNNFESVSKNSERSELSEINLRNSKHSIPPRNKNLENYQSTHESRITSISKGEESDMESFQTNRPYEISNVSNYAMLNNSIPRSSIPVSLYRDIYTDHEKLSTEKSETFVDYLGLLSDNDEQLLKNSKSVVKNIETMIRNSKIYENPIATTKKSELVPHGPTIPYDLAMMQASINQNEKRDSWLSIRPESGNEDEHKEIETFPRKCARGRRSKSSRLIRLNEMKKNVKNNVIGSIEDILTPCLVCGKCFMSDFNLRMHMTLHRTDNDNCTLCGKKFSNEIELKDHLATVHCIGNGKLCSLCEQFCENNCFIDKLYKSVARMKTVNRINDCTRRKEYLGRIYLDTRELRNKCETALEMVQNSCKSSNTLFMLNNCYEAHLPCNIRRTVKDLNEAGDSVEGNSENGNYSVKRSRIECEKTAPETLEDVIFHRPDVLPNNVLVNLLRNNEEYEDVIPTEASNINDEDYTDNLPNVTLTEMTLNRSVIGFSQPDNSMQNLRSYIENVSFEDIPEDEATIHSAGNKVIANIVEMNVGSFQNNCDDSKRIDPIPKNNVNFEMLDEDRDEFMIYFQSHTT